MHGGGRLELSNLTSFRRNTISLLLLTTIMSGCGGKCGQTSAAVDCCCQLPCPGAFQQPTPPDICSTGCKQSPIDICSGAAVNTDMTPLKFTNHWMQDICLSMTVARNTVLIKPPNEVKMTLEGGPLKGRYVLDQLHFHWGDSDRNGSEHSINGQKMSMEAHLVYYSSSYCKISDAIGKPQGIIAIAVLMESKPTFHNCHLDPIISNLCRLKCPGSLVTISKNILKMFKEIVESQEYFAYEGSLTTSPCSEDIIWMVFKNYLCIHCSQVEPFRNLTNEEGKKICMNWRRTQPLNGRTVYNARVCSGPCS